MLRTTRAAASPVVGTAAAGAQVAPTRLSSAIALTAYEVGSGHDDQEVAVGKALCQRQSVGVSALRGRDDGDKGAAPGNARWALERQKIGRVRPRYRARCAR
jgi:hypothetical protein